MEQKAFEQIAARLQAELEKQGFTRDEDSTPAKGSVVFLGSDMAYGVFYEKESRRFSLRYCDVEEGVPSAEWRSRSVLLFDPENEEDAHRMAESIAADFVDEVTEKDNTAAAVKALAKTRHKKTEDSKTDALFFYNRLVNLFPELREEITVERITYGEIRTAAFAREKVLPRTHALLQKAAAPDTSLKKLAEIYSELYMNGDADVRAVITWVLLNSLSDEELARLTPYFSADMTAGCKAARHIRGKKLKPEKPHKMRHIVAENLDGERR